MKKSQRFRLATLAAQATRTAAEQSELETLQTLATAHPDATKDADDAAPVATGFAGVMAGIGAAIRGRTAAGTTVAQLTTERDHARASLATAQADLATARASLASATAQVSAFTAFFAIVPESLAGQSAEQLTATITAAVGAAANAQLAGIGIPAANLPAPTGGNGAKSLAELMAEHQALADKPAQQAAFYTRHIDPLISAAAQAGRN